MARQADRSQAFNDIFGRPSSSRPQPTGPRYSQHLSSSQQQPYAQYGGYQAAPGLPPGVGSRPQGYQTVPYPPPGPALPPQALPLAHPPHPPHPSSTSGDHRVAHLQQQHRLSPPHSPAPSVARYSTDHSQVPPSNSNLAGPPNSSYPSGALPGGALPPIPAQHQQNSRAQQQMYPQYSQLHRASTSIGSGSSSLYDASINSNGSTRGQQPYPYPGLDAQAARSRQSFGGESVGSPRIGPGLSAMSSIDHMRAAPGANTEAATSYGGPPFGSQDSSSALPSGLRLPSLDVQSDEYNWFGSLPNDKSSARDSSRDANGLGRASGGDYTQTSTPSVDSSAVTPFTTTDAEDLSPESEEKLSGSMYNSDFTSLASNSNKTSLKSYPASIVSTTDLPAHNQLQLQQAYEIDSKNQRVSPGSVQSASYSIDSQQTHHSRAPSMHQLQRNQSPFDGFQQQYPAALQDVSRATSFDRRTSVDSDHTSHYMSSTFTNDRQYAGGPPTSTTSHNFYPTLATATYSQQQSGYHPSSAGYQPLYSSPQHSGYTQGAPVLRHASRKSAESVRVYPTQPKPASAYGERALSFSGIDRPQLVRPPSHSPRPTSSISELPGMSPYHPSLSPPHQQHSQYGYPAGSGQSYPQPQPHQRRAPIVYPALLSRVAEAFKSRITLAERTKDGLSYKDAFDGREAVDKIAYIIRTTDRNLALLLGRALDAQKFFHDVTYDHRLRDSPHELYQFRERLHSSPFGTMDPSAGVPGLEGTRFSSGGLQPPIRPPSPTDTMLSDDSAVPSGVFTLLTDCYSPTCTRDRLCYSIACPRRLEQQARLNMKPKPGLKKSNSEEGLLLDDDRLGSEPGMLWIHMVPKEISDSVDDTEKKRQEAINELIYTERDFVRDMEYLRDKWMTPLRTGAVIPEGRREQFVTQVFWNVTEIHSVNIKLAEALTRRQKTQPVVNSIGDLLLKFIPDFGPFVKYGAHQLYGKYEFEKEKGSNPAFAKFVETTERLPESRKLELNGYLTKPTTRLARYPLLLEAILKHTAENNPDKENIPKAVKLVRELLAKVNHESGRSEARFNLAQLDQQLVFRPGEAVDLKLRDEKRDLIFKGPLRRKGGTQSESAELQVFLFDHAILMVKAKSITKNEQYKVYRRPIPLELLLVTTTDDAGLRTSTARPKSLMSRTSNTSKLAITTNGSAAKNAPPDPTSKQGFPITFTYLGRKGYTLTLWSPSWAGRKKWLEKIEERQTELREMSMIFETSVLSEGYFIGTNRVTCAAPYDGGTRMVFGTDNGVYLVNLLAKDKAPVKVISVASVTQVDVLEDHGILVVLADRAVQTFSIDALDPQEAIIAAKKARKISTNASFFKTGVCLNRTLVCIVKSGTVSSTIKTLEPIDHSGRAGKKQPSIRKLLQGGNELLKIYKEFYIPTESSSVHFLKSKLCVGCTKGFEIVDLDTLDTQGLLDPADSSLDFVQKRENVRPLAIYRVDGEFLLCYDEFAFYVNKNGWRARSNWIVHWEGNPTAFALHYPYVLAFEPNFIEVRHVDNGNLMQIVPGHSLRLLFADTPPSASSAALAAAAAQQHLQYHPQNPYQQQQQQYPHPGNNPYGSVSRHPMYGQQGGPSNGMVANPYSNFNPPVKLPGPRKQIIFASDAGVLTLRESN